MWQQNKRNKKKRERERIRDEINYRHFCTVVILHFVREIVTFPDFSLPLHLLRIYHFARKWCNLCHGYVSRSPVFEKYSVIQKDGLKFVHLYFLNYTRYVNDLHNV